MSTQSPFSPVDSISSFNFEPPIRPGTATSFDDLSQDDFQFSIPSHEQEMRTIKPAPAFTSSGFETYSHPKLSIDTSSSMAGQNYFIKSSPWSNAPPTHEDSYGYPPQPTHSVEMYHPIAQHPGGSHFYPYAIQHKRNRSFSMEEFPVSDSFADWNQSAHEQFGMHLQRPPSN